MRVWLLGVACAVACTRTRDPYGEAILHVDVDAQIPRLVSRLRLDIYSEDGTRWIESREVELSDAREWPASFSVYNRIDTAPATVLVRLRAFPSGVTREYRGERFTPRPNPLPAKDPAPVPKPTASEAPRLLDAGGLDITPRTEPSPFVTIDRLLRVRLVPGVVGRIPIVLRGDCAGTMADLVRLRTCVANENVLEPVSEIVPDPTATAPQPVTRTFGARVPCTLELRTPTPGLFDDEVCVPGGGFLLGDPDGFGEGDYSSLPQRTVVLPPFRMDKYEVTVARWRASGFVSPDLSPQENSAPLGLSGKAACTFSPAPMNREDYPLNCVSVPAAQAFCESFGGSLPTEAEWRWVAQDAERDRKTHYPWGDDLPTCDRAVFARLPGFVSMMFDACVASSGKGPARENDRVDDVAIGTNVANLAGSMAELTIDAFHGFGSRCWASVGLYSPRCVDDAAVQVSSPGASWNDNIVSLASKTRRGATNAFDVGAVELGFRCVRRDAP